MKKIAILFLTLVMCAGAITAFASTKVKVGVVGSSNEQWTDILAPLLAKEGIELEIITFSDFVQPNIALANGEIEMNAFQHYNYLNNWNEENSKTYGKKLVPIGETYIAPLGLYSNKYKSVDEIKDGETILVVNDVVNEARALALLEKLNLIKLNPNINSYATVLDITSNPKNLIFKELDAAMIASQMSDKSVAAGFMNGLYASQSGYKQEDAIATESFNPDDPVQHGIVNIIAVREEDADNPVYKRIAEAYQCDEVKQFFEQVYPGIFIPAWTDNNKSESGNSKETAKTVKDGSDTSDSSAVSGN